MIPALAVARELRQRGHRSLFCRARSAALEAKLVPAGGFRVEVDRDRRVESSGSRDRSLRTLAQLPFSDARQCGAFRSRQVRGGLQHGRLRGRPPVLAALLRRSAGGGDGAERDPGVHESRDRRAGVRARWSAFRRPARYFPDGRTEVTGLPVREEFFRIAAEAARATFCTVLITGGSQGSRTLNQAARESWPLFRKAGFPVRLMHQTGPACFERTGATSSRQSGLDGEIVPFIADMPAAFARRPIWWSAARARARCPNWRRRASRRFWCRFPLPPTIIRPRNAEALERGGRGAAGAGRGDERASGCSTWCANWRSIAGVLERDGRGGAAVRAARARRGGRRRFWRRSAAQ